MRRNCQVALEADDTTRVYYSGILHGGEKMLRDRLNLKRCDNDFWRFSSNILIYVDKTKILGKIVTCSANA